MEKTNIEKQPDGTIKLTISISKSDIQKTHTEVLAEYTKNAKVSGFRPGKAPSSLVEEKLDRDKIKEEILKKLLPIAYSSAIQGNNIKPIMNPKIQIESMDPEKDWIFTAQTCEEPQIDLGDYKKNVQKITAKSKIIIPGKDLPAGQAGQKKPSSEEIMKAVVDSTTAKIPAVLIEQETDRLLSQLLNDIKKLALNLDQYLASTNRTPESLRLEYAKRAEEDMKLEFALHKIAETEKITIEPKEIDEAIQKAKDETERSRLESNRYTLAAILRQQKTLDFLLNL